MAALVPLTSLWALTDQCMSGLSRQRYAPDSSRGLVALQPLFQALKVHRSHSANMVAQDKTGKNPAFVACMTALLRWPDFKQPLHPPGPPRLSHCLACPTVWSFPPHASPTRLLASRPPRFVDDIFEVTQDEMRKGFCGPLHWSLTVSSALAIGGSWSAS